MARTGQDFLKSLNDGRNVYYNGEKVANVAEHPAFSGIAHTVAKIYDMVADPANDMTYPSPKTGEPVMKCFMIPRSVEDLKAKRLASRKMAEATYGLVGRSPEHVANFFAGFASMPELYARGGQEYADRLLRFYEYARDNHLYITYAIVQPQIDRSRPAHELEDPYLAASVYEERKDGIVIRGAQMLATGGAVCDYVFLTCIQPLKPGDENYAIAVAVPTNDPNLKLYFRRGAADGLPSTFDYPLSTRFDESDALCIFDDVFVPWERVFIYKNTELVHKQFFETPAHVFGNTQAQTRLVTKLKFLLGLVRKITSATGSINIPQVQQQIGYLAAKISVFEGFLLAAEAAAEPNENGVYVPKRRFLYSAMALQPYLYNEIITMVRELSGGGFQQLPATYRDLLSEVTAKEVKRYYVGPGVKAEDRVKLFKLAWDMIGSEFAGRHHQYEMFYGGAPFLVKGQAYRFYNFAEADQLVEQCLAEYDLPDSI